MEREEDDSSSDDWQEEEEEEEKSEVDEEEEKKAAAKEQQPYQLLYEAVQAVHLERVKAALDSMPRRIRSYASRH